MGGIGQRLGRDGRKKTENLREEEGREEKEATKATEHIDIFKVDDWTEPE